MDFFTGSRPKVARALVLLTLLSFATVVSGQQPRKNVPAPQPPAPQPRKTVPAPQPVDTNQLLATGQVAQESGRFDEALAIYSRVISIALRDPKTLALANMKIGSVYLAQRRLDTALVSFQRSLSLNPESAEAHNYYGETMGEMKQYPRALESFNRAIALDQTLLRARYNMGITYARMGNMKYSEFVFRSLIKNYPTYSLGYDGLAVTLSRSGKAKEAIPMHEKAISLLPGEPSYYYNLGLSYLILGDTTKALEQQQKLRTIDVAVADQLASVIIKRRT
jgi:tetratricopeptide (TPR) repeat protein